MQAGLGGAFGSLFLLAFLFAELLVHFVQLDPGAQKILAVFHVTCMHDPDVRGSK